MSEGSLSQEEINALFNQGEINHAFTIDDFLSPMEQDALGEIGNISLGSSTTALSTLLNQRVEITAPVLVVIKREKMEELIREKHVAVHVDYTSGIHGKNLLMIKENDAKIIANLMMGGDGIDLEPELSELHLSAVQEAMNQMMGSAATSMSTMFHQKVDISPPEIDVLGFPPKKLEDLGDDIIIEISFRLKIGELIDSKMIQFIPLSFGKEMIEMIFNQGDSTEFSKVSDEPIVTPAQKSVNQVPIGQTSANQPISDSSPNRRQDQQVSVNPTANANVQKVEYSTFSEGPASSTGTNNIDMLYDIPLEITVELGRTKLPIRKILELAPGSVIQLDKLAGEPVDILANHKLIAKGEVVVIEENFGVRITDIISPIDRLTKMTK
ncbi:flagellar motor switch phosphatase FliY [Bacillus sp. 1NLA3E]|uniref:flagellar motor switch phosphatase FliY n=1 Tax=Bacillus sp. 1NLA3E TaxID=666686 RepID=UPI000247F432|nr:flagellar motor switch phosphatase FliY [Bacillus sp. 1NLA3E]AGK55397.1 flagellar motor switch protein [Bacillus sp. 1NLA3E]